jgi:four helix bundle protein
MANLNAPSPLATYPSPENGEANAHLPLTTTLLPIRANAPLTTSLLSSNLNLYHMLVLSHKKLDVYILSLQLVKNIYQVTGKFPPDEKYTLVNQLRRAAISVCSNIAEGAARRSKQEKKRFYEIARSSAVEIDTQLEIALLLDYVQIMEVTDMSKNLESVFRILSKMIDNLENAPTRH